MLELLGRRPMYGYEIVQAIQNESGGALAFGEGCIYPLLHKLEASGDLASRRMEVGGRQPRRISRHAQGDETIR